MVAYNLLTIMAVIIKVTDMKPPVSENTIVKV
jgi:hypothetical protein